MGWELALLDALQSLHGSFWDMLMVWITSLANGGIFWLLLAAALIMLGNRDKKQWGLSILLALVFSFVTVNLLLKPAVDRIRPFTYRPDLLLLVPVPRDASFPSGHSSVSFAGALSIYLYDKKWGILALLLAVLIAFSRLYLYVHFPTDVLFGAAMGCVCACASHTCLARLGRGKKGESV